MKYSDLKKIIFIVNFVYSSVILSQVKVKGYVFDYSSGNPLKGTTIEFYHGFQKINSVKSGDNGVFENNLKKGTYRLILTKEEYKVLLRDNLNISGNKDIELPFFYMEGNTEELDEIIIKVKKRNISINNNGISLNIDDSPFFEGISIPDALNIMPGVTISSDNSISILGKSRILILVNGRETNLNINNLPAKNVEKIVVDSSPSAKYDSKYDAIIKITLKKWVTQGLNGGINSSQTFNKRFSQNYNTYLNYNKNKLNISSYFAIDDNETLTSDDGFQILNGIQQNSISSNQGERLSKYAYLNFNYDLNENSKLGIELDYLDANSQTLNNGNIAFGTQNISDSTFVSTSKTNWDGYNYSLGAFYSISKENYNLDISTKFFKNSNDVIGDFLNQRVDNINTPDFSQNTNNISNSESFVANLDYVKSYKKDLTLESGLRFANFNGNFNLDITVNNSSIGNSTFFDFDENIYAFYTTLSKQIKKFSMKFGTRLEFFKRNVTVDSNSTFSINNFNFFPSLSLDYAPSKKHYYKLSYSKKISRPSFNQITPFEYITSYNTKFVGNTDLKNQIDHNLEFWYQLNRKYYFILFFNYNQDLIEQTGVINPEFITINQAVNYDYYTIGFQTGFRQKITPWLTSIQKFSLNRVVSNGSLLSNNFNTKSWESHLYAAQVINLKKLGSITVVSNYYTPNYYDIYKVDQGFKLDAKYSLKMLQNKLTASITFRDALNTYHNRISSEFINQNSFFEKDINNRDFVFSLSYVFDKGRKKNIKTGADIKEEKNRLNNN